MYAGSLFAAVLASIITFSPGAFADLYQLSVASKNPGDLIHVKNCIDYALCAQTQTSFFDGHNTFRFHTFIKTDSFSELSAALASCNLKKLGIQASLFNKTKQTSVAMIVDGDTKGDLRNFISNVYIPRFSEAAKINHYDAINQLLKSKKHQEAINYILGIFKTNTLGYSIEPSSEVSASNCTTTHVSKKISIGKDFFDSPCDLMQAVRHEYEHAYQYHRVLECRKSGANHNLDLHINRERSAYLDDYYNIPLFCSSTPLVKSLQANAIYQFRTSYTHR